MRVQTIQNLMINDNKVYVVWCGVPKMQERELEREQEREQEQEQ